MHRELILVISETGSGCGHGDYELLIPFSRNTIIVLALDIYYCCCFHLETILFLHLQDND
jgi:hypothetical protein